MQVLAEESNVAPGTHDEHPFAEPSTQVAHDGSHAVHVLFASAYLPSGQLVAQDPSSKYFVPVAGHVKQLELAAPLHVSHDEWHVVQTP